MLAQRNCYPPFRESVFSGSTHHPGLAGIVKKRNCTIRQNNANSRAARTSTSKYKGVSWNRRCRKWVAYIKKDGRQKFLGSFIDEKAAEKAYDAAAKKLHGQFAALNLPD